MDAATITAIVLAVLSSAAFNTLIVHFISVREKKNGLQDSLRLMMKDRLRFLCASYIEQGWIYQDELDDIIAMHKCYHDELKGNGFLDVMMAKVKTLEIRGIGVK